MSQKRYVVERTITTSVVETYEVKASSPTEAKKLVDLGKATRDYVPRDSGQVIGRAQVISEIK